MFENTRTFVRKAMQQGREYSRLRGCRGLTGTAVAGMVGFGLVAFGGIVAIAGLVGVLFVPAATFPTIDAELTAFFGLALLIGGIIVHAFGSRS